MPKIKFTTAELADIKLYAKNAPIVPGGWTVSKFTEVAKMIVSRATEAIEKKSKGEGQKTARRQQKKLTKAVKRMAQGVGIMTELSAENRARKAATQPQFPPGGPHGVCGGTVPKRTTAVFSESEIAVINDYLKRFAMPTELHEVVQAGLSRGSK